MGERARLIALALAAAIGVAPSSDIDNGIRRGRTYDFVEGAQALGGPAVTGTRPGPRAGDVLVNDPTRPGQHLGCTVQSETSVAAYERFVYVGYNDGSQCLDNMGLTEEGARLIGFARSTDRGKTFHEIGPLRPNGKVWSLLGDPVVTVDTTGRSAGTVYLASIAGDRQNGRFLAIGRSTDRGRTFQWNYVPTEGLPDKEWIAIDNSGGPHDGTLYITWYEAAGYPPGIYILSSKDGGRTWVRRRLLEANSVQGARVATGPEGEVHVVWQRFANPRRPQIRWSRSLDGGRTYSRPITVARLRDLASECDGASVQGMRVNELPSIAIDTFGSSHPGAKNFNRARGTVYVVYASNTRRGGADVFLSRLVPGSRRWSPRQRVNDDATNNGQFFPEVAATGPGDIAISWTDRREDKAETPERTSGNWLMRQWIATSTNGGRTISRNRPFSDILFPPPFSKPGLVTGVPECYAGDYNALYSDRRGHLLAAWSDNRDSLRVAGMGSQLIPDQNVYFRAASLRSRRSH